MALSAPSLLTMRVPGAGHRLQDQGNGSSIQPQQDPPDILPALLNDARLGVAAVFDDTRAAIYRALQGHPASQQEVQGLVSSSNSFQAAKFQYELATDRDRIDALTVQNAQLQSSLSNGLTGMPGRDGATGKQDQTPVQGPRLILMPLTLREHSDCKYVIAGSRSHTRAACLLWQQVLWRADQSLIFCQLSFKGVACHLQVPLESV